jgi:F-type H+-transporting ATPase subunit b
VRARKAADTLADETKAEASKQREEMLAAARRDIEHETRRALDDLRREVADLTVTATEKITRKSLTSEDHRRLIEEALSEVDFSELAPSAPEGNGN